METLSCTESNSLISGLCRVAELESELRTSEQCELSAIGEPEVSDRSRSGVYTHVRCRALGLEYGMFDCIA